MLEQDPLGTGRAIRAGQFDRYLTAPTLERLTGKIDRVTGDAAASGLLGGLTAGGAVPPAASSTSGVAAGLQQDFQTSLDRMLADARDAGFDLRVGSGGRSPQRQAELYAADVAAHGGEPSGRVAPPGRSLHERGAAADLVDAGGRAISGAAADWVRDNAGAYGIAVPMRGQAGMPNEPWHVEPAGARGSATGGGPGLADLYARIDRMGLGAAASLRAKEQVRVGYNALEADQLRQEREQQKAAQASVRQAEDQIIADAYGDSPQITAQRIAVDPRFAADPERRLKMIQVVRNAAEAGPPAGASHQQALSLLDRIRRPDGDPDKITDDGPIYDALIGNRLLKADFDFVRREFDQQRTPAGEVFGKRKAEFLRTVAPAIDDSAPLKGWISSSGKLQLYEFEWLLDQKIDEYRKSGKNPLDLLDPAKPDYMGRPEALAPFQKTLQQSLRD
jgi:hypothetical protein